MEVDVIIELGGLVEIKGLVEVGGLVKVKLPLIAGGLIMLERLLEERMFVESESVVGVM